MFEVPLEYSWVAAENVVPDRIVIAMRATLCAAPPVQKTVDRRPDETEEKFIGRVMRIAKEMMRPYGLGHHAELYCVYGAEASEKATDRIANFEYLLWHSATDDKSYQVRVQALVILSALYGVTPESIP